DAYLALNPKGTIPTFVDGDLVLTESAAICLYLADRHPEARLSPPPHTPEWSRYFESLIHLTNTVQPALMAYHYPEEQTIDGRGSREIRARAEARVVEAFRYLNE